MNAIQALSQLSYTPIGERFLYLIVLEGCICYKPGSQLSYTPKPFVPVLRSEQWIV